MPKPTIEQLEAEKKKAAAELEKAMQKKRSNEPPVKPRQAGRAQSPDAPPYRARGYFGKRLSRNRRPVRRGSQGVFV